MSQDKTSFVRQGGMNIMQGGPIATPQAGAAADDSHSTVANNSKVSRLFDGLLTLSLVAIFLGVPLFFLGITYQGIAFEKQMYFLVWLLVGLIAWVSKSVITGEMAIRRTPLDIPILALLVWYGIATLFSFDRWHSFWGFFGDPSRGFIFVLAGALFYSLLVSHFTPKRFALIWMATLFAGGITVLWSTLVLLGVPFLPEAFRAYAPLTLTGSLSNLAVYGSMLLPLFVTGLFGLFGEAQVSKWRKMAGIALLSIALLLDLFLLLGLYNYVPWIVVLVGLALFLIYILARIVRPAEQLTWLPMALFVCVLMFLMIGSNSLVKVNLPIEVSPNTELSWQIARETVKANFLTGVGPAQYGYAFSMYRPIEYNQNQLYTLRFYQGKNVFLESLATAGALGAILLGVLWLSYLSIGLYLLTVNKAQNKTLSLGLFTASAMFFLAGIFGSALGGSILLIGLLLGALSMAVLLWESHSEKKYIELSLKASPKFALALAFIFMVVSAGVAFLFVFLGKVAYADIEAGKAIRLSAAGPNRESTALLLRAIEKYPQEGRYYTRLGQEYMALANQAAVNGGEDRDEEMIVNDIRSAVVTAEAGHNRMPNDVLAAETLALIYENAGLYTADAFEKALEAYGNAQKLEPENPVYFIKIGQINRAQADAEQDPAKKQALLNQSKASFEKALEKKQDLAEAHYQIALTEARGEHYDASLTALGEALKIDPQNLNYEFNRGIVYQLKGSQADFQRSEEIFRGLLKRNERLIDVRLSLGLLYERMGNTNAALTEYRIVLGYLPESDESVRATREQVQTLIDNVNSGRGNLGAQAPPEPPTTPTPENIDEAAIEPTPPSAEPAPLPPEEPNRSPLNEPVQP